jgi:hypothetical protein
MSQARAVANNMEQRQSVTLEIPLSHWEALKMKAATFSKTPVAPEDLVRYAVAKYLDREVFSKKKETK